MPASKVRKLKADVPRSFAPSMLSCSLLRPWPAKGDGVTLVGDLHNQFHQFVQLTLYLEETLGGQGEPYQLCSWSRPVISGPPMAAICCLRFQSCSSGLSWELMRLNVDF
ncbi:hypothetical protein EYF80_041656 [Liparis tanakae]|uniref:Uncharacterized protein n=1 Tax=Liparis tanakae TaxID=230148 RepID=A0A4Z2G3N8_9TELE|nr:hypothetical protein EYF80_041656 [Liparis tanakae]